MSAPVTHRARFPSAGFDRCCILSRSSAAFSNFRSRTASFSSCSSSFLAGPPRDSCISSIRARAAPSSSRSMALSGRYRSGRYRRDRRTASFTASSEIRRWWCRSSPGFSARRIASVASSPGSSTTTGRNRRSSAASFSIYFRYSSRVVAPSICSSPRPRAGLKMFAASMAPSAAPAPTMVCISSTKRITSPLRRISPSTSRRRSSNSPRYLVPATRDAMFRLTSRLSFNWGGTLPTAIRWASPSAMAVFPTPGSPTSAGLFLFFRHRMPMTVSISRSLPITGSMPDALRIRSSLNCSRSFVVTASFFPLTGAPCSQCR